jgi:hypothetical protein
MKIERVTIWTCTETYGPSAITALDYVLPALDELEGECKVLGWDTEEYSLTAVDKAGSSS